MWHWPLVAITKHRVLITVTCINFSIWRSSYVTCAQHACRSSLCRNVTPVAAVATYIRCGPQYRSLCTDVSRWFGRCIVRSLWAGRLESRASISCRGGTNYGGPPPQIPVRWIPSAYDTWVKRSEREPTHSPVFMPVAKNSYSHISTPLYVVPGIVLVKHYIIIIIRQHLGLDGRVSVSSNGLF